MRSPKFGMPSFSSKPSSAAASISPTAAISPSSRTIRSCFSEADDAESDARSNFVVSDMIHRHRYYALTNTRQIRCPQMSTTRFSSCGGCVLTLCSFFLKRRWDGFTRRSAGKAHRIGGAGVGRSVDGPRRLDAICRISCQPPPGFHIIRGPNSGDSDGPIQCN